MFINQLSTCVEEAENPNWLLSRVAGIPLDFTPTGMPDSVIMQVLTEGTAINFSEDALNQFTKDLYAMMGAINEKEGVNHWLQF